MFVGPAWLNAYDAANHTWITCEVKSAHAETGSNVSRTGIGGSRAEVEISTKGCGSLLLRQGITQANSKRVATALEESGKVEIEVGFGVLRYSLGSWRDQSPAYRLRLPLCVVSSH